MYIGKPQHVFTIEPLEHPVPRKRTRESDESAVLNARKNEASLVIAARRVVAERPAEDSRAGAPGFSRKVPL